MRGSIEYNELCGRLLGLFCDSTSLVGTILDLPQECKAGIFIQRFVFVSLLFSSLLFFVGDDGGGNRLAVGVPGGGELGIVANHEPVVALEQGGQTPRDEDPGWHVRPLDPLDGHDGQRKHRLYKRHPLVPFEVVSASLDRLVCREVLPEVDHANCVLDRHGQVQPHIDRFQCGKAGEEEHRGVHL